LAGPFWGSSMVGEGFYDFAVVGSGFGGSVAAMRLAEKGYRVLVLEEGLRWEDRDFPPHNRNPFRYIWAPRFFMRGYFRIHFFRGLGLLGGVGVGGGSLVYANVHLVPPDTFFQGFPPGKDWKAELMPFYERARFMLGTTPCPVETRADEALKEGARRLGVEDTFHPVDVGVFFGEPEEKVPDPYFGGLGPDRVGCTLCGNCMTGCRVGAKNTLLKNYLYFAQKYGARIVSERRVVDILQEEGGYTLVAVPGGPGSFKRIKYRAQKVVLAAGVVGTLKLLFALGMKERLQLPSDLGRGVRTNSESLLGIRKPSKDVNFSEGLAITSGVYLDDVTHVEVVRYGEGSDGLAPLAFPLAEGENLWARLRGLFSQLAGSPGRLLRAMKPRGWARETIILLVMQTVDNMLKMGAKRGLTGRIKLKISPEEGHERAPVFIPGAHSFARTMAEVLDAMPFTNIYEAIFNSSFTAHILGGCCMGRVVDEDLRLLGHEDFYVVDASVIPSNLGVNPSLTITALAEYAMEKIPFKKGFGRDKILSD